MHIRKIACALMLAGIVAAVPAATGGEIYRWTDAEGNVHYRDRPTGAAGEERLAISSSPTDRARVQAAVQTRREARAERTAQEQASGEPSEEELRAQAEERAKRCETARERLQKFLTSRRLYRHDENGERVYLDEAEVEAARTRVQEQVLEYCGS